MYTKVLFEKYVVQLWLRNAVPRGGLYAWIGLTCEKGVMTGLGGEADYVTSEAL